MQAWEQRAQMLCRERTGCRLSSTYRAATDAKARALFGALAVQRLQEHFAGLDPLGQCFRSAVHDHDLNHHAKDIQQQETRRMSRLYLVRARPQGLTKAEGIQYYNSNIWSSGLRQEKKNETTAERPTTTKEYLPKPRQNHMI